MQFMDDDSREQLFEQALRQAQQEYEANNNDAQALVKWGGALLELAHYKQGNESIRIIEQAIKKLQQALDIDPGKADAEWCLGNAHTSLGFLRSSKTEALKQFKQAEACFRRCLARDPDNETFRKAIDMCGKAPEYYDEIQAQLQQGGGMGGPGGAEGGAGESATTAADFWYDIAGWGLLGLAIMSGIVLARGTAAK